MSNRQRDGLLTRADDAARESKFESLQRRLEEAQQRLEEPRSSKKAGAVSSGEAGISAGFAIAIEMLVALAFGVGIGVLLDNWLGTSPWILIVFSFLGMGAAVSNAVRKGKDLDARARALKIAAEQEREQNSVKVLASSSKWEEEEEPWLYNSVNQEQKEASRG